MANVEKTATKNEPVAGSSNAEEVKQRDKRHDRAPHVMEGMEGVAVAVRGAYKRHAASSPVLNGLDMTVKEGHIYGLLGPSGCGKTTLLRSIVGIVRLDQGTIYVKAHWRDLLGYMPQDLGLYDYMTIMEAFHFYGKLYGMKKKEVEDKGSELVDFLELPKGKRLIRNMSGGQQRRLSFAVTLLHDPDLMILDEPTVGLDPVLCASIWDRLVEMTKGQGKTIIITTHYIEETKQANMIGLMRDGVLLEEKSPQELMKSQKCNSLEEAFLRLSEKQESQKKEEEAKEENKPKAKKKCFCCKTTAQQDNYPKKPKRKCLCISREEKHKPTMVDPCPVWNTRRFSVQLVKNIEYLWRNYQFTLFNLLLPACIALLSQLVLGKCIGDNKKMGVVSPELGPRGLDSCKTPYPLGECAISVDQKLTCAMVEGLERADIKPEGYQDLAAGKKATRSNTVWGVLVFHANYTSVMFERMMTGLGLNATQEVVDNSYIDCYMDMSNMWISTYLRRTTKEVVRVVLKTLLTSCQHMIPMKHVEQLLDNPLSNKVIVYGDAEPPFIEFFLPGVICTFAFYLSILYTTGAIMFERSVGLERSLVAGMTKLEVIMAHVVIQILLAIAQQLIILLVFYVIFKHTMVGSYPLLILLLILVQIMGLFYGLVLGLFFDRERDATNAGVGTINALFMVAGVMWPEQGMHPYMKAVVPYVPVQPAVECYRAIAMRGWSITYPTVYMGYVSTLVWTAVFIMLTVALTRSHKDSL